MIEIPLEKLTLAEYLEYNIEDIKGRASRHDDFTAYFDFRLERLIKYPDDEEVEEYNKENESSLKAEDMYASDFDFMLENVHNDMKEFTRKTGIKVFFDDNCYEIHAKIDLEAIEEWQDTKKRFMKRKFDKHNCAEDDCEQCPEFDGCNMADALWQELDDALDAAADLKAFLEFEEELKEQYGYGR